MEKIVILKGSQRDDALVNCLRMLFPECAIEVHENNSKAKKEKIFPILSKNDIVKKIRF
jgi:hypothetical protein